MLPYSIPILPYLLHLPLSLSDRVPRSRPLAYRPMSRPRTSMLRWEDRLVSLWFEIDRPSLLIKWMFTFQAYPMKRKCAMKAILSNTKGTINKTVLSPPPHHSHPWAVAAAASAAAPSRAARSDGRPPEIVLLSCALLQYQFWANPQTFTLDVEHKPDRKKWFSLILSLKNWHLLLEKRDLSHYTVFFYVHYATGISSTRLHNPIDLCMEHQFIRQFDFHFLINTYRTPITTVPSPPRPCCRPCARLPYPRARAAARPTPPCGYRLIYLLLRNEIGYF